LKLKHHCCKAGHCTMCTVFTVLRLISWHLCCMAQWQPWFGLTEWYAEECCEEDLENSKSGRGYDEDCLQAGMLKLICFGVALTSVSSR